MDSAVSGALQGKTMRPRVSPWAKDRPLRIRSRRRRLMTSPAAEAETQKIEDSVKDEETPGESTED